MDLWHPRTWNTTGATVIMLNPTTITQQVKSLLHFFIQFFNLPGSPKQSNNIGKNIIVCLEGKSMTRCRETLFSVVPHSNSLVSPSDPWRDFWTDTVPFKGPRHAYIASRTSEVQGEHQVCRARCWGPITPPSTIDANPDCAFAENAVVLVVPNTGVGPSWLPLYKPLISKA